MNEGLLALHHPRIESARVDISAEGKHDIGYMPFYKTKQYSAIEKDLKRLEQLEVMYSNSVIDGAKLKRAFDALSKENEKTKKLLSKEIEKNKVLEHAEENERILSIIRKHLTIVEPVNDTTLIFDIDLWDMGGQKEEFAAVKEWLEKSKKDQ